jgi:hypothetical protein
LVESVVFYHDRVFGKLLDEEFPNLCFRSSGGVNLGDGTTSLPPDSVLTSISPAFFVVVERGFIIIYNGRIIKIWL